MRWVESHIHGVTLVFAVDAEAPEGFVALDGRRWRTAASLNDLADVGRSSASPSPSLVPIGLADDGSEVLVDLETSVTTVVGEPDAVQGLLRAVAVAAATAPWSDQARVMLVGRVGALPPVDGLEACEDVARALDELLERRDAVAHNIGLLGFTSIAEARASGVSPDAWEPLVVVFTEQLHGEDLERLRTRLRGPSPAIAIVLHGAPETEPLGRCMCVEEGRLTVDWIDMRLRCRELNSDSLRAVAELFDQTALPSVPAEEPAESPRRHLPVEARPADAPAPRPLDELLRGAEVMVHVLGEVRVTAPPGDQPLTIPKQKSVEALTYLALRESSVDKEELQAALWPSGTNTLKTFHNTIWAARKALSTARPDSDLFPEPVEGRYSLSEGIVTDYGVFSELAALADEQEDAREAAMLLSEALTLVDGEPFTGGGRGYAWVAPHTGLIIAQVVDAAEELAEVRLAGDDWRGAEWAARQGLKVCPYEERLYRLLMRSAFAAGSVPGVRRVFDELTDLLADPEGGVEPEDTVHPDTVALLERLTGPSRGRHSA